MEFSKQECWTGFSFPNPGDLTDQGVEPEPLASPALAGGFFTTAPAVADIKIMLTHSIPSI